MMIKNLIFGSSMVAATVCFANPSPADQIRFDGLGDLKIGQSFGEVSKLFPNEVSPVAAGLRASSDCYHVSPTKHAGITLMFKKEHLVRIDVTQPLFRTSSGLGIGDDFNALKLRYHDAVLEHQNGAPEEKQVTIVSPDKLYAFRFTFDQSRIDSISAGQANAVALDEGCY
jgi:hypothetical protein